MKAMDAGKLQKAPNEETTESTKNKRESGKPSAELIRATASEAGPGRGPGSAAEPQRELPTSRAQAKPGSYTQTGRGSAERSRAARPRWVTMEIPRKALASTTVLSDSSAGACCFKNDKTSDPSRPRAPTTNGVPLRIQNFR